MPVKVTDQDDVSSLRESLRVALSAALRKRCPRWLLDMLAESVGELAAVCFHEADPEEPAVALRAQAALRVWNSYERSQGIVDCF
jgi:hypothetical protein